MSWRRMAPVVSQQDDTVDGCQWPARSPIFRVCPPLNMWNLLTGPTLPQLTYAILFCCVAWLLLSRMSPSKHKPSLRTVAILVLGDVGRSPRMMYHAESFAKLQFETFLVGYGGAYVL